MTSKRLGLGALCVAAIATFILVTNVLDVHAQTTGTTAATGPNDAAKTSTGKEVALTGRIVDFHCFMTGKMPSTDAVKCTADCIRAGVPVGLETGEGLIVLGKGIKGPANMLRPFAQESVEVRGILYEDGGVRYLDISSIKATEEPGDEED